MNDALEEIRCDLMRLRSLLPVNGHRAKGLFSRIERNVRALSYAQERKARLVRSQTLANTPLAKDVIEHVSADGYEEE